ncbi:MAG: hypothetical protein ACRDTA_17705 [Pseudonocardiaceae bacterium]
MADHIVVGGGHNGLVITSCVITAMDPRTALMELLDPPLSGAGGAGLRATHRSNAVQMLVLLATTALPGYAHASHPSAVRARPPSGRLVHHRDRHRSSRRHRRFPRPRRSQGGADLAPPQRPLTTVDDYSWWGFAYR